MDQVQGLAPGPAGHPGLETTIVLIAFEVVSSVFGRNTGLGIIQTRRPRPCVTLSAKGVYLEGPLYGHGHTLSGAGTVISAVTGN